MKRRTFLQSSLAGSAGLAMTHAIAAAAAEQRDSPAREFYELRLYHLRRGPKQQLVDTYFRDAFIPAMNRIDVSPIGVFHVTAGPDSPTLYVLIPHKTLWQGVGWITVIPLTFARPLMQRR